MLGLWQSVSVEVIESLRYQDFNSRGSKKCEVEKDFGIEREPEE
jgi:hypothetical protein